MGKPSDQPETTLERYYVGNDEAEEGKPDVSHEASHDDIPQDTSYKEGETTKAESDDHESEGALPLEHRPRNDISAWLNMVLVVRIVTLVLCAMVYKTVQITKGETDNLPFETRHEALRHLAVALPLPDTNNRFSFALWKLYLEIYNAKYFLLDLSFNFLTLSHSLVGMNTMQVRL